jgi:hypothetical protein
VRWDGLNAKDNAYGLLHRAQRTETAGCGPCASPTRSHSPAVTNIPRAAQSVDAHWIDHRRRLTSERRLAVQTGAQAEQQRSPTPTCSRSAKRQSRWGASIACAVHPTERRNPRFSTPNKQDSNITHLIIEPLCSCGCTWWASELAV